MKFVKIVMHAAISLENSFAIESIKVYRKEEDTPYVPALDTLRDLESWLIEAFKVGTPATRELSIGGLQVKFKLHHPMRLRVINAEI